MLAAWDQAFVLSSRSKGTTSGQALPAGEREGQGTVRIGASAIGSAIAIAFSNTIGTARVPSSLRIFLCSS